MNKLKYESIPLNLLIKNYEPIQFTLGHYTYSDKYTPPTGNQSHGSYILYITTGGISNQGQLNTASIQLRQHAETVMMLFKYITGTSLFHTQEGIDLRRKRFLIAGECPDGWTSNYTELNNLLDKNAFHLQIISTPSRPYAQISLTPLHELQIMLKQYNKIDATTRYLMQLNYEADVASDMIRCLVYGKVIEMIDAIHPLSGNNDRRIEEYYDGMQETFQGMTIKDLMGLANTRADTRHYAKQKGEVKAHPFLTYEELGIYGPLIDNLAINEVRLRFGLPLVLLVST